MGREKDRLIEEDEQGWRFRDGETVCYRCLYDPYLRTLVKSYATEFDCSFCTFHTKKNPCAITFNALMEVVGGAIRQYYGLADDEGMGWDGEEGTYFGITYDRYDLVHDEIPPVSENTELLEAITDSLSDRMWCERSPYSLSGIELLEYSWESFCESVKYRTRYFFGDLRDEDAGRDQVPVGKMLDRLLQFIKNADLLKTIGVGTEFFRVRPHAREEVCDDWKSLGSPPGRLALSNRMSAAGISMFYGSFETVTAKAETLASLAEGERRALTIAKWTNTRPLQVVDLIDLPPPPDFYSGASRDERDQLLFLQAFVENITQAVEHDGREHIEYVPTQIMTEYFRHRARTGNDLRVDGIVYPSAQRPKGRNIVIFASQDDLDPTGRVSQPILALVEGSRTRLRVRRRIGTRM